MRALARWCYRHRWVVAIAWICAIVAANAIRASAGTNYNDNFSLSQTESYKADKLLALSAPRLSGDTEEIVIAVKRGRVTDPVPEAAFRVLLGRLSRLPHVTYRDPVPVRRRGREPDRSGRPDCVR